MKKRLIFSFILILIISGLFCGCKDTSKDSIKVDSTASLSAVNLGEGKNVFVFVVQDVSGEQMVYNISTDKKIVGDALKEHNLILGDEGDFGLYVKTVNNITYDYDKDGKYWAFYVDGEYAQTGVDKTEIKNGTTYMFKAE